MPKKIFSLFFAIFLILIPFSVTAYEPTGVDITAKAAMLVSLDTGEVLYAKNANKRFIPSL